MKYLLLLFSSTVVLFSSTLDYRDGIDLDSALEILKDQNLEIKAASYDTQAAQSSIEMAKANHFGKLEFTQDIARSNDAGNVFGFKLSSREATFGDFGFSEFSMTNPDILNVQPKDLNYPEDRNYFQSKLTYELPIYVGGKIMSYTSISKSMKKIKELDHKAKINEKVYQLKKSFYDMALLESSMSNMEIILEHIETLENTTKAMIDAGYAKKIDLLEVQSKKSNVTRIINEMSYNKKLLYHFISFLLNQKVTTIVTPQDEMVLNEDSNETILANNIDILKAENGLSIRDKMVDVSYATFLPTIGAKAEFGTADNTFLGDAYDHKSYTVGGRLSWNLFAGGADYHSVQKARIEHLKMNTQLQLAKKGMALQLDKLKTQIKSLDFEIDNLNKEYELANAIAANYEGRYKEKLVSMNDVIIKQSELIKKVLALQEAKNRRNERIFAYEKLINKELKWEKY